jgi:hypothetical protein
VPLDPLTPEVPIVMLTARGEESDRIVGLEPLGSTTFSGTPAGAEDARLDPDGDSLWVVETGAHAVGGFAVRGGHLTQLASSPTPLPAGATAFGMVVT